MATGDPRPAAGVPSAGAFALAICSAMAFASSGPLAKALIDAGWSSQAAVAARITGGAVVLLPVVVWVAWPSRGRLLLQHSRHLVAFGLIAVAGAQIGFFNAVRTLPVGVALLIEYLSPVLVVGWLWAVRSQRPGSVTLAGAAVALCGTALVIDPFGGFGLDSAGVAWALFAACCSAGYFILAARRHADLPPVLTLGVGLLVGSATVLLAGALGLMPLDFATDPAVLADREIPWWVPVIGLALVSGVLAYLLGMLSVPRLGSRLASFLALTEVLFAVVFAWWLLDELPTGVQFLGGALVLLGIVLVRTGEASVDVGTTSPG